MSRPPGGRPYRFDVTASSLEYDRETKIPLYARHGIPEVWLIDLRRQQLTVYRDPAPGGYQSVQTPATNTRIAPCLLPEAEIAVGALF